MTSDGCFERYSEHIFPLTVVEVVLLLIYRSLCLPTRISPRRVVRQVAYLRPGTGVSIHLHRKPTKPVEFEALTLSRRLAIVYRYLASRRLLSCARLAFCHI